MRGSQTPRLGNRPHRAHCPHLHPPLEFACDEIGWLMQQDLRDATAGAVTEACTARAAEAGRIVGCFDEPPIRTTAGVRFETSLADRYPQSEAETTRRCELNAAACHSDFERQVAAVLDSRPEVHAWVRNFRLDWSVPYSFRGRSITTFPISSCGCSTPAAAAKQCICWWNAKERPTTCLKPKPTMHATGGSLRWGNRRRPRLG